MARPNDVMCALGEVAGLSLTQCDSDPATLKFEFEDIPAFPAPEKSDRTITWEKHPLARSYRFWSITKDHAYYEMMVSAGRAGDTPSFTVPDLSDVEGFDDAWAIVTDETTEFSAMAGGGNVPIEDEMAMSIYGRYIPGVKLWWASPDIIPPANGPVSSNACEPCDMCVPGPRYTEHFAWWETCEDCEYCNPLELPDNGDGDTL